MKAIRVSAPGQVSVVDVPDPEVGAEDVLVEVEAAGMCATDTHIIDGHYPAAYPVTLGHEFSGRIVDVGREVDRTRVGELVTIEPHEYDRTCMYCRIGQEHMCVNKRAYGVHLDGGMAEFVALPARLAYRVPEGVSAVHAAMTEPIACCVHAMDRLNPLSGLPVTVHGCGPAGSFLIGLARLLGLSPIIAVDPCSDRRELAVRVGAHVALDPNAPEFATEIASLSDGYGVPCQIDAVGSPAVLETAIRLASRKGSILIFGVAAPEATALIRPQEIYAKELSLLGTAINPYTHHRAVGLLQRLPLSELRLAEFPIDAALDAFDAQRRAAADKIFVSPKLHASGVRSASTVGSNGA